ncbi:MAG TPA: hypothetical protein VG941_03050 [Candidatus Paceibacterota bacterium]|nr:hypothetical protein [Candidatus Paceibacterota bacterium]
MSTPTTLTPEQEFDRAVRWTAGELKKESLATFEGKRVYFEYQSASGTPQREDQRRALKFLENHQAITIKDEKYPFPYIYGIAQMAGVKPLGYYLEINQEKLAQIINDPNPFKPLVHFESFDAARGLLRKYMTRSLRKRRSSRPICSFRKRIIRTLIPNTTRPLRPC